MSGVAYYMNNDAFKDWKRDVCWSKLLKSWSDVEQFLCLLDGYWQGVMVSDLMVDHETYFDGWEVSEDEIAKHMDCYKKRFVDGRSVSVAAGEGVTEESVSATNERVLPNSLVGIAAAERRRRLKVVIGEIFEQRGMDKRVVARKKEWGEVYGDVLECCRMKAGRGGRNAKDVLTKREFVAAVQEWCDEVGRADWRPAGVSSIEIVKS